MPVPPRRPGSQVAPGQRPFNSDAPTAQTHNKRPIHELTAGRSYRVRDKDWAALWGEDMSWDEANALKERLVAERRSTTARVEDMALPPPAWWGQPDQHSSGYHEESAPAPAPMIDIAAIATLLATELAAVVRANPIGSDDEQDVLAGWIEQRITEVLSADATESDAVAATPPDPYLEQARHAAHAAVRPAVQAANARQPQPTRPMWPTPKPRVVDVPVATPVRRQPPAQPAAPRVVPRDKTIVVPAPRTQPPPRDKTVASEIIRRAAPPDAGEPEPMMSPLKAAMLPDEFDLPEGSTVLGEDDLSDLLTGVGGGPSDEDHARAKAQAEKDRLEREKEKERRAGSKTPPGGVPEAS